MSCFAQQDAVHLVKTIAGSFTDFTTDNLGNIYTLDRNNLLKKLRANGDSAGVFNEVRRFGKVSYVDAANPLKVLLYYQDFGTVVVLDRFLNIRNTINLREKNLFQVRAICQSYDNGIWLYDEQDARLKKLNDDGDVISQSADFRLFMETVPSPVRIVDQDRLLYLYDPDKGLFIFDYFGTLKNKVALLGWQDFQVINGKVFGRKNNLIQQYQPGTLALKEQAPAGMPAAMLKMIISTGFIYCLTNGGLDVYAF